VTIQTFSSSYHSPIVAEKETEYAKTIEPIYPLPQAEGSASNRDKELLTPDECPSTRPETVTVTSSFDVPGMAPVITVGFTLVMSSKRLTPTVVG
jgi:hypothetical protein